MAVVLVITVWMLYQNQARRVKVSEFGKYQGYSRIIYVGHKRISDYVTLSDSTLGDLADGGSAPGAILAQRKCDDAPARTEWLRNMVRSSYAIVVVDRPGTGASFGQLDLSPEAGARETGEILNWIAVQKWCDGNIEMFSDSIQAQIQFQAASTGNPRLKAILAATTGEHSVERHT